MPGINKILGGIAVGLGAGFVVLLFPAHAAEIYMFPAFMESAPGQTLVFELRIDTQGETVNVVQVKGKITGDVKLVSADFSGSRFSIYPEAPEMNAADNTFAFTAAEPNGFKGGGVVGRLTLETAKRGGSASITITPDVSRVYLNTPQPTLTALTIQNSSITVNAATAIVVSSKTHPVPGVWSVNRNPQFRWETKKGSAYSYLLSRLSTEVPDNVPDTPIGDITYNNLDDGIYYFLLCEVKNSACGPVTRYPVFIDTTPPEWVSLEPSSGTPDTLNKPYLSFLAKDALSGVVDYRVSANSNSFTSAMTSYVLESDFRGEVAVEAVDRAGNSTRKTITIGLPLETTGLSFYWLVFALGAFIVFVWMLWLRKRHKQNSF